MLDSETCKKVVTDWSLQGLGIGVALGFVLEVAMIRSSGKSPNIPLTIFSILAVGLMGWISFAIAQSALPNDHWKSLVWAFGVSGNTWIGAKVLLEGQVFAVLMNLFLPKELRLFLKRRKDDS